MEVKSIQKITPINWILLLLLLSSNACLTSSHMAWAQSGEDALPTPKVTISPENSPSSTSEASPTPVAVDSDRMTSLTPQGEIPLWIWILMGVLGVWSTVLSVVLFRFAKWFETRIGTNDQKIRSLEAQNTELHERMSRRTASIQALSKQISAYGTLLQDMNAQKPSGFAKGAPAVDLGLPSQASQYRSNALFFDATPMPTSSHHVQPENFLGEPWSSIVLSFNTSAQMLEREVVERVSETEESLMNRRSNRNAPVFLKAASNYSYWIFGGENHCYWLTPKNGLKINPVNFDTLQAIFESQDYQPGHKLQLIKPAQVAQNSSSGTWELLEKGQVQFVR